MNHQKALTKSLRLPTRSLAFLTFLLLHVSGVLLTTMTLLATWKVRQVLQIIYGAAAWFFMIGMVFVLLLGVIEAARIVRRGIKRQPEEDVAVRLRALLYVLVGCVFLNVFVFSFRIPLVSHISLAFGYGGYTLWSMRLPRLRRKTTPRVRRMMDVVCMNVMLTLVIAEIALRVVATVWPIPILVTDQSSQQDLFAAYRPPAGASQWGFEVNRSGFYDTEFVTRSDVRGQTIVSIGDSFSSWIVPHSFHFTTVCERELPGSEIYNMGFAKIGPREYLYLLEHEALPLKPDAIIINLFVGNDLTDQGIQQESNWYDSERFLVSVVWQRLRTLVSSKLHTPDNTETSERTREQLLIDHPHLGDPLLEQPTFDRELFLNIESQRARDVCARVESTYERFFQALDDLKRAAGDVPLAFMLIPDEFQIEDKLWEEVANRTEAKLDRFYPQRRLVKWLQSRDYPHLDLLPILRSVPPLVDQQRHLYFLQDTHFNPRGNEVTGKALADFLETWLTDSSELGTREPGSVAATASRPEAASAHAEAASAHTERIPLKEAAEIVRTYAALLPKAGVNGSVIVDSSLLPFPKDRIMAAAMALASVPTDPAEKESFAELAKTLAFFQPGVGDTPISLDEIRSDGDTWRSIVETDMRNTELMLFENQR